MKLTINDVDNDIIHPKISNMFLNVSDLLANLLFFKCYMCSVSKLDVRFQQIIARFLY